MSNIVAAYAWSLVTRPDFLRNSNVSTMAKSRVRSATSFARAATSSRLPPAAARRAASRATNPSPIDALFESTNATRPEKSSAARAAC
jgi:hypothetical protein